MSELLEIAAGLAVVAYVVGRQLIGEPLRGKRVVILPAVLTVIGVADLAGNKHQLKPVDLIFLIVGAIVVAGIGSVLGRMTRLESRNGALWGQLPVSGLWLWLALIVSRVLITVAASGADAKVAASTSSILLMLGINRLAQAAVIMPRAISAAIPFAPEKDGRQMFAGLTTPPPTFGPPHTSSPPPIDLHKTVKPDVSRVATPTPGPAASRSVGTDWAALGRQAATSLGDHHRDHHDRHRDRHDRRRDRG